MPRPLFERHDLSQKRRVLAVGDIHGCFSLLERELEKLEFDPELDVLILLGDLVDRGDENHLALEWCKRPGTLRIRGNHEQILRNVVRDEDQHLGHHIAAGGYWFHELIDKTGADPLEWSRALNDCPIVIEAIVPGGRRVGFVHADINVDHWSKLEPALVGSDPDYMYSCASYCMWGRDRIKALRAFENEHGTKVGYDCSIPGIDHVYFGHSIVAEPTTHSNCSWIDTGAYRTEILTVAVVADRMSSSSFLKAA